MAARGRAWRRGIVAAVLLAAAFAVSWWWQRPVVGGDIDREHGASPTATVGDAAAAVATRQPPAQEPGGGPSAVASREPGAEEDAQDLACSRELHAALARVHAGLRPDRSAEEAATQATLSYWLATADPTDWASADAGTVRAKHDIAMVVADAAFERATARWPDDRALAWLRASLCADDRCDSAAAQAHLQAVDGGNAATWLQAMTVALRAEDRAAFTDALRRAGEARDYGPPDDLGYDALRPALEAVDFSPACLAHAGLGQDLPVTPAIAREQIAVSLGAMTTLPHLRALVACADAAALPADAVAPCRALLELASMGEATLAGRSIALSLLVRAPDVHPRWRERYRQTLWLAEYSRRLFATADADLRALLMAWHVDGEIATLEVIARERGDWPPPRDWLPEDPQARERIAGRR